MEQQQKLALRGDCGRRGFLRSVGLRRTYAVFLDYGSAACAPDQPHVLKIYNALGVALGRMIENALTNKGGVGRMFIGYHCYMYMYRGRACRKPSIFPKLMLFCAISASRMSIELSCNCALDQPIWV
jgi:hypothetical protein